MWRRPCHKIERRKERHTYENSGFGKNLRLYQTSALPTKNHGATIICPKYDATGSRRRGRRRVPGS